MFHAMIHCEYLAITNVHLQSYFTLVRGFHCIAVKFLSIHHWWIGNGWFLFLKYHCIVTCNIYWAPTMYQVLSKCFTFTISSALHTTHWWGRHCYYAQGNESQRGRSYDAGGHHVGEQQSRDSRPSLSDSKVFTPTLPSGFFNWMVTALQSSIGFCHSAMQISCECMNVCDLYILYTYIHTYISVYIYPCSWASCCLVWTSLGSHLTIVSLGKVPRNRITGVKDTQAFKDLETWSHNSFNKCLTLGKWWAAAEWKALEVLGQPHSKHSLDGSPPHLENVNSRIFQGCSHLSWWLQSQQMFG